MADAKKIVVVAVVGEAIAAVAVLMSAVLDVVLFLPIIVCSPY